MDVAASTQLRVLRPRPAARFNRGGDLFVRVYFLPHLCDHRAGGVLSELRGRTLIQAPSTGVKARGQSTVKQEGC